MSFPLDGVVGRGLDRLYPGFWWDLHVSQGILTSLWPWCEDLFGSTILVKTDKAVGTYGNMLTITRWQTNSTYSVCNKSYICIQSFFFHIFCLMPYAALLDPSHDCCVPGPVKISLSAISLSKYPIIFFAWDSLRVWGFWLFEAEVMIQIRGRDSATWAWKKNVDR